jgi:hypothetical protein
MATGARQLTPFSRGHSELRQFAQGVGPDLMDGAPQGTRDGLQIRPAAAALLRKDASRQLIQFPRSFPMDCSSRFFLGCPAALLRLDRAECTDPFIDTDQVLTEFLKAVELVYFTLRLA